MLYRVLGPLEVVGHDGVAVPLPGDRERVLLATLVLGANRVVSTSRLVDAIWGEDSPATAGKALQVHVSNLRKKLTAAGRADALGSAPGGYVLHACAGEVDLARFEELVEHQSGGPAEVSARLGEALSLWRGPALADVPSDLLQAERLRLDELRLVALERRIEADLALGRHLDLLPELQSLVRDQPFREALRGHLMVSLYRAGPPGRRFSRLPRGEAGPRRGARHRSRAELRALELGILNQEPGLAILTERDAGADKQAQRGQKLPQPLSSFVGREGEMATLSQLVTTHRVTAVVGTAGVGKTRLALQVATRLADEGFEGVCLTELASLRDPALVVNQVAEAIGVPEQPGRPIVDTLVDTLGANSFLIVLDNCEHLLDASAELVESVLERCPGVHVLATSREPLGVEGEHLYRLVPLATPLTGGAILVEEVGKFDAVQLFVERAASQRADFTLDDANAGAVAAVCQHLDGIPLAIELAAARLRSMSVFDLESNLADRFRFLTGGRRTALPRHRSLKAMIDWSYEMLLPAEQTVLCRLSPFVGGCRLDAAQQVCAGGAVDPAACGGESLVASSIRAWWRWSPPVGPPDTGCWTPSVSTRLTGWLNAAKMTAPPAPTPRCTFTSLSLPRQSCEVMTRGNGWPASTKTSTTSGRRAARSLLPRTGQSRPCGSPQLKASTCTGGPGTRKASSWSKPRYKRRDSCERWSG